MAVPFFRLKSSPKWVEVDAPIEQACDPVLCGAVSLSEGVPFRVRAPKGACPASCSGQGNARGWMNIEIMGLF